MEKSMQSPRRHRIRYYFKRALLVIGIIVAGWLAWRTFVYFNPRPLVDFQYYEPTKVVDGLHLASGKRLEAWTASPWTWFAPYGIDVSRNLNRPHSWIEETKWRSPGLQPRSNCDSSTVGEECFTKRTARGQPYILMRDYEPQNFDARPVTYTKLDDQIVEFVKNGTIIAIDIPPANQTPISDQAWSDMIDSFVPAQLSGFTVYRMHPE